MASTQWNLKVKIQELDRGGVQVKNRWNVGESVTVQIEPHATINMLKQRIALIVACHMKHQHIANSDGQMFDDESMKLEDCPGIVEGATLLLHVRQPPEEELPPVVISDDEGLWENDDGIEPLPEGAMMDSELTDEQMDKQNSLKGESAELLEDGDKLGALKKLTEAILIGKPSAMMLSKRGELLLKLRKPVAAAQDASVAIGINPDSGKAYRIRGKARRYLGEYREALADLNSAQSIDYDDGVADVHAYVKNRVAKLDLKAAQDAKKAAAESSSA
jgi:suppressor of tumorigenicity protein 13